MKISRIVLIIALGVCVALIACAQQKFPEKPVTIIIPFSEGSATDAVSRMVGNKLAEVWGQQVVFENHPGAGGTVGTGVAAEAQPDGHTLLVSAAFVSSQFTRAELPYDPKADFVEVAPLAKQAMAIIVSASSDKKSLNDVIEAAKAKPGEIKFGTPGVGSGAHLAAEKFRIGAGIDVVHSPTKGVPATMAATKEGRVDYTVLPIAAALKGVDDGSVVALAITSGSRSELLPDVPTVDEAAVSGFDENLWWGVWTNANTPPDVLDKLSKDIAAALASPDLKEQLGKKGFIPMSMSRTEFAQFVQGQMESVGMTVKEAGIGPK